MLAQLDAALGALFLGQLKNLHKQALASFKRELSDGLKGEAYSFADVVAAARAACEKRFVDGAEEARLKDTDWTFEDELTLLREEMDAVAVQCRSDETKKMVNVIEVRLHYETRFRARLGFPLIARSFLRCSATSASRLRSRSRSRCLRASRRCGTMYSSRSRTCLPRRSKAT